MKNKLAIIYKEKFLSIAIISIILTIVTSFTFIKKNNNSILQLNTSQINDNKIIDIIIHANPELDDNLLNIYLSQSGAQSGAKSGAQSGAQSSSKISYNVANFSKTDGEFLYMIFKDIFFDLVKKKEGLLLKTVKKENYDHHTIIFTNPNIDDSYIAEFMTKIFLETEMLIKERLLFQVFLIREEKIINLGTMDDLIPADYSEKYKLIVERKNRLLKERLLNKKLTDLIEIKNHKLRPMTKSKDLIVRNNSSTKYGQILLLFLIYHLMIFFIIVFLNPKVRKKSLKVFR